MGRGHRGRLKHPILAVYPNEGGALSAGAPLSCDPGRQSLQARQVAREQAPSAARFRKISRNVRSRHATRGPATGGAPENRSVRTLYTGVLIHQQPALRAERCPRDANGAVGRRRERFRIEASAMAVWLAALGKPRALLEGIGKRLSVNTDPVRQLSIVASVMTAPLSSALRKSSNFRPSSRRRSSNMLKAVFSGCASTATACSE